MLLWSSWQGWLIYTTCGGKEILAGIRLGSETKKLFTSSFLTLYKRVKNALANGNRTLADAW